MAVLNHDPRRATPSDALRREADSLRQRLLDVAALLPEVATLSDEQLLKRLNHIRPFVHHLAVHGRAEENIVYPYIPGEFSGELPVLREDHARLAGLADAIAAWQPCDGRASLAESLQGFYETADAHLALEGEDCMQIVQSHVAGGVDQALLEAVELASFESAAQRVRAHRP